MLKFIKNSLVLFLIVLSFVNANCLGSPSTNSVTEVSGNTAASESEDAGTGADALIDFTEMPVEEGTTDTGTDYVPDSPGNVNLPNLTTDNVIISAADSSAYLVLQGSITNYDSTYGTAVVNTTQYGRYQAEQKSYFAKFTRKIKDAYSHVFGKDSPLPVIPVAMASGDSGCFDDLDYITEITVNSDGTFTPQAVGGYNDGDVITLVAFDTSTCDYGAGTATDVIENLFYVAWAASGRFGIAKDGTSILQTDVNGNVVKIGVDEDSGKFEVQNDFFSNYVMASVGSSVSAMMFNPAQGHFNFMGESLVFADSFADGLFTTVTDSSTICVNADGCTPVAMKQKGSKSYFITEYDESVPARDEEWIHELYNDSSERIQFLDSTILDALGRPIRFRAAKAFDVVVGETQDQYLVVFEDGRGIVRLFGEIKDLTGAELVTARLDSSFSETRDIIIYSAQSEDDSNNGNGLAYTNDEIYFILYDVVDTACSETEIEDGDCDNPDGDGTSVSIDTSNPIVISNLVSVVVNDEGTYAYALDGDTIHVINLLSHATESNIALNAVIGHDIEFSASAILYTSIGENDYLVVSSDSLKSAIVVDLSQSYE